LRCSEILLSLNWKFTRKFVSERILKIRQHLAKLEAKVYWHLFSGHGDFFLSPFSFCAYYFAFLFDTFFCPFKTEGSLSFEQFRFFW